MILNNVVVSMLHSLVVIAFSVTSCCSLLLCAGEEDERLHHANHGILHYDLLLPDPKLGLSKQVGLIWGAGEASKAW